MRVIQILQMQSSKLGLLSQWKSIAESERGGFGISKRHFRKKNNWFENIFYKSQSHKVCCNSELTGSSNQAIMFYISV